MLNWRSQKVFQRGLLNPAICLLPLAPAQNGNMDIIVESIMEKQFRRRIRNMAMALFSGNDITEAMVRIQERGALECILRARMETAIERTKK